MAPLRILYIDTGLGLAGGQVSLVELLKHLAGHRFQPFVCSPEDSALEKKCSELGVVWLPLPTKSVHLSTRQGGAVAGVVRDLFDSLYGVGLLAARIRANRIDIVHANTFKGALVGGLACLFVRRPMIFHDRTHIDHGVLGRLVASMASRIIVVSHAVGAKHKGRAGRKARLVYNGIDTDRFAPTGAEPLQKAVCFLGRISEEKDVLSLVECASLVLASVPAARFLVAGEPFTPNDAKYLESVRARIRDLRLDHAFEFLGHVDDVRPVLNRSTVLALPSKNEPLGRVVLEAMALRRPVIAFDIGGPREIITSEVDGILVPPGDLAGFARAIVRMLTDRELAHRFGEMGRQTVTSRFSSTLTAGHIEEVYREICPGAGEG
ncbi:MAG: glycosyltransferase [Candidatus Eisenbacteria bacterium]